MHDLFSEITTEGLHNSGGLLVDAVLVVVVFEFSVAELSVEEHMTR